MTRVLPLAAAAVAVVREAGCARPDRMTRAFNGPARPLCDTVARRKPFLVDREGPG